MTFWGSVIDPSKAGLWSQRPAIEEDLPALTDSDPSPATSESSSSTSSLVMTSTSTTATAKAKPTDHLPEDHDTAEGETHIPTFPDQANATTTADDSSALPTMTPTPDEGYFSHMGDLLSNQTWLFGGLGIVFLFAVGAGVFFWRRRVRTMQAHGGEYATVADDEMAMTSMLHGGRAVGGRRSRGGAGAKELYDAFGEVSDGEEEEEEEMGLQGAGAGARRSPMTGLRYHDGFLDDDGGDSNAASPAVRYRDEPVGEEEGAGPVGGAGASARTERRGDGEGSPASGSGSSWEHAHVLSSEALNRLPT